MPFFSSGMVRFPDGIKGIIFDCDGVLIDSKAANIYYYNLLLQELKRPPLTPEQECFAQMATSREAIAQVLTPEEMACIPELVRRLPYREISLPLLEAEPGLINFLNWLRDRSMRMAVHTNRTGNPYTKRGGVWDVLDKLEIRSYFDQVVTIDMAEPKPSPEGALKILREWGCSGGECLFVGDSETDRDASCSAGIPFAAYRSPALAADYHVDSFQSLQFAIEPYIK